MYICWCAGVDKCILCLRVFISVCVCGCVCMCVSVGV